MMTWGDRRTRREQAVNRQISTPKKPCEDLHTLGGEGFLVGHFKVFPWVLDVLFFVVGCATLNEASRAA